MATGIRTGKKRVARKRGRATLSQSRRFMVAARRLDMELSRSGFATVLRGLLVQ